MHPRQAIAPADRQALLEAAWRSRQRVRLRLSFEAALEAEFQAHYADHYRQHMVLGLGIGMLAIIVSAFEDFLLPPEQRAMPLFIRFGLMLPMNAVLFLLVWGDVWRRWQQPILLMTTLGGALGFMLMGYHTSGVYARFYVDTLVLVLIFGLVLLRMQFPYAVASVLVIGPGAALALFHLAFPGSDEDHVIDLSLIVFAGTLCLIGNYLMERSARIDFVQQQLLGLRQQALEASNRQLQQLLRSDALTGIANRRHFDQHLADELRRAERGGHALALLMIDVDCFKPYNDNYGHQAGDEALAAVAAVLGEFARRPGDLAARYGGEEFALILPGSNVADAGAIADELVLAVAARAMPHAYSSVAEVVTVSVGVAAFATVGPQDDAAGLIARADEALYRAKHEGRNRAVQATASA
ncbi:MAG: diguanylate cyclase domain-containing protein [Moraxellaceae bacterium]